MSCNKPNQFTFIYSDKSRALRQSLLRRVFAAQIPSDPIRQETLVSPLLGANRGRCGVVGVFGGPECSWHCEPSAIQNICPLL
jgi:hypothetical protein